MRPVTIIALLSLAPYAIAKGFHLVTRQMLSQTNFGCQSSSCKALCVITGDAGLRIGAVASDDYSSDTAYMDDKNFPVIIKGREFPPSYWGKLAGYPKLCGTDNVAMQGVPGDENKLEIATQDGYLLAQCILQTNKPNDFYKKGNEAPCPTLAQITDHWICSGVNDSPCP